MRKTTFIAVTMVVLLFGHWAQAGVSVIMNGSFEYDGVIEPVTEANTPYSWSIVNVPMPQFGAEVRTGWSTYGAYSLTLKSYRYKTFVAGDMVTISQQVYLTDVNHIYFDLKLSTEPTASNWPWDPAKRSAVLLIDDIVVWEANSVGGDIRGEYTIDVGVVDVNGIHDEKLHKLSLGLRANVDEDVLSAYIKYLARWDFVRFDTHCDCGGFDYPPGDFNRDCYVDWLDFQMLFEQWLDEEPDKKYDLFPDDDNIFNFYDFAVFATSWIISGWGQEPDDYLLYADLNNDGIVNMEDFAITAKDWDSQEADFEDILTLAEEWLEENWLYGLE